MSQVESLPKPLVHAVTESEITEPDSTGPPAEDIPCIAANVPLADVVAGNVEIESDAAMAADPNVYNIIPINVPAATNIITSFPEVRAAISSLRFLRNLPNLPDGDVLDYLEYVFGFQKASVSNQRENIVILLSDEQSWLSPLEGDNPMLNDAAVQRVFYRTFDNYTQWCTYVKEDPIWKGKKATMNNHILYISLYYLIWGEAANVRFLPECLCYIFHRMGKELDDILLEGPQKLAKRAEGASYLENVIRPLYVAIASEANNNGDGKAPYSTWRNYDDFNEYFWSRDCFTLGWPLDTTSPFFSNLSAKSTSDPSAGSTSDPSAGSISHPSAGSTSDPSAGSNVPGKTFIERRTFLHLYHSFHRLWIFLVMVFQGLVIIAWNDGKVLDFKTLRDVLSLGPTYFLMKLFQCVLDFVMMHGAHSSTRIKKRFIWFTWATFSICFLYYVIGLHVNTNTYLQLIILVIIYIIVMVIYVAIESYQSMLAFVLNWCDNSLVGRFLREIPQEDCYVGRHLVEGRGYYISYMLFWLIILAFNFQFAYDSLIIPLVTSSRVIVLENTHTVLAFGSSWVGAFCVYLLAVHVIYTGFSGYMAFYMGVSAGLGKIKSMDDVHKNFKSFPEAFMKKLHIPLATRDSTMENAQDLEKENVARFSPFWNKIVDYLREEDYITTDEQEKLRMPASSQGTEDTTIKWPSFLDNKSEEYIPRNPEARRRLAYFTNSLFMSMPKPVEVRKMIAFSVFTPYYDEIVLYSEDELFKDKGNKILVYLQNTYPDEWENFIARMKQPKSTSVSDFLEKANDRLKLELRFWASYRGQTLARTVRGMMYNREALIFQSYMEEDSATETGEARAYADLKFTYVITCQLYSDQKKKQRPQAADIERLLERNEALRVAFIDEVVTDGQKTFFSKLLKYDINGKENKVVYSIELPGQFKLGEGKPENQNHAIVFTRGSAVQTIDMNQDNYFEETLKMRNLLEEFRSNKHGVRPATILGVREHVYTERASTVASFMSKQENSFVTLAQRVLAGLKVRMHYGHPDVFDRVFHITRGGISKASRGINISEDIYAGFNSTLRNGNITHHEYIQVGKGRDVGLHQIAIFESKVAGGNGDQLLSRDVYRLGQRFDFFRMLSFYYTSVGYYFYNWLMVITLYILLYGQLISALSDIRVASIFIHPGLFWFLLIIYPASHIILCSLLEQDFEMAGTSYFTMLISGSLSFFAFTLGTRMHWFGRTILHGGSGYQATGRGFVLARTKFSDNYKHYLRSHFVKAIEIILLGIFIFELKEAPEWKNTMVIISGFSLALAWIIAPFLFDPVNTTNDDHNKDYTEWKDWLDNKSWEAWWKKEISHIQTFEGKAIETILSLRFFIIQYVVYQKMDVSGAKTHFMKYGSGCGVLVVFVILFEISKPREHSSVNLVSKLIKNRQFRIVTVYWLIVSSQNILGQIMRFLSAFIPTGWGILSICLIWGPVMIRIGLWDSVISLARRYHFSMGYVFFSIIPITRFFRRAPNKAGKNPPDEEITAPTTGDANVNHANVIKKQPVTNQKSTSVKNGNDHSVKREEPAYPFLVEVEPGIFLQQIWHEFFINQNDVSDLKNYKKLDVGILTVFEMSLYRLKQSSKDNRCCFLNPSLIASHDGHDAKSYSKSDAKSYLQHVVENVDRLNYEFLLAPYFRNVHWVLFIICPKEKKGFILDSCKNYKTESSYFFTSVVEEVVDNMQWVLAECNQQLASWECGYYVLKWMHDFVTIHQYHDDFPNITPWATNEELSGEELNDIVDKWFAFFRTLPGFVPKENIVPTTRDTNVNYVNEDEAKPSIFALKEKEEMQSAVRKNDDEDFSYQAKPVKQDESSSVDSRRENVPRMIADSEKAKKLEELISTIAKAMVLAKELGGDAGELVQVPMVKEEHESSIEQVEEFEKKVEDPLTSEQGEGNTAQACTRNE